jgi:protein subunit release factor B
LNSKAEIWLAVSAIQGLSERAKDRLRKLAGSKLTLGDEIHLSADTSRSQEMNREEVMDRLRAMIVEAKYEPKVRRKTKPSRAARAPAGCQAQARGGQGQPARADGVVAAIDAKPAGGSRGRIACAFRRG